jgi:hypothetical protein
MLKGISLPINAMIVIIITALVLVVIGGYFITGTTTSTRSMSHTDAWNRGCSLAKARGCLQSDFGDEGVSVEGYDPDGDGRDNSVKSACINFLGPVPSGSDSTAWCRAQCCG